MKNILFYGASVTHQTGKTGFFENLKNNNFIFTRMTFPSSQFYNAGFYNIPRINKLEKKPEIVFFEWSTTGETVFDSLKLNFFIKSLIISNILPVFLILPKKDTFKLNRSCDDQLYNISFNAKVPLLDLRDILISNNIEEVLRDGVHTTELGAKLYAERIDQFLSTYLFPDSKNIQLEEVVDFNIATYDLNCTVSEGQSLSFVFTSCHHSEIAIYHTIGPYSPVLEYICDGKLVSKSSIFDTWCHYERDNFTTLVSNTVFKKISTGSLVIKISLDSPDYSITKTGEVFDLPKKLDIKSIYTCDLKDFSYVIN